MPCSSGLSDFKMWDAFQIPQEHSTEPAEQSVPRLKMTKAAYEAVMLDLVQRPFRHEQGGILLGPEDAEDLVVRYIRDEGGLATPASFTIDHESMNKMIREVRPAKLACVGIIHSHPDGVVLPSGGDLNFLERLFSNPKNGQSNSYFHFPIVANGHLHPYVIDTNNIRNVIETSLEII